MSKDEIDHGEKLNAPPDFDGPISHRRCTDVLCTLLLFGMWISMTGLGIYAIQNGDYRLILYPLDYDGNVCGTDYGGINMTEFPYLYYVNDYSGGVCVKVRKANSGAPSWRFPLVPCPHSMFDSIFDPRFASRNVPNLTT